MVTALNTNGGCFSIRIGSERIEQIVRGSALVVGRSNNGTTEWGGMMFRSPGSVKIAEALYRRGLLFFGNARGRIGSQGSPLSASTMTGRLEIDFLVFQKGKCINLEIDGKHHQEDGQTHRDYIRDRLLLREGIATARFTAQECMESPDAAIEEFLNLF
ncbi:MAG: DUF559 domain-containing protein [Microcystis aeruginosa]